MKYLRVGPPGTEPRSRVGGDDLIGTGAPEEVVPSGRFPYLRAGGLVEIAGLGRQRTVCGQA